MKTLMIERGDKKFDYQIHQLKAMEWVNLLFEIGQSITDTESFTATNMLGALGALVGINIPSKNEDEPDSNAVAGILQALHAGKLNMIIDLAISVINGLDESRRIAIISKALSCVYFNNGNPAMGGGMIQLNLNNIDLYITHPIDVLTLTKEAMLVNYEPHILSSFFKKAPNTK